MDRTKSAIMLSFSPDKFLSLGRHDKKVCDTNQPEKIVVS